MNIFRDKQIKHFSLFIAIYSILLVGVSTWFSINQLNTAKSMYLEHDRAIVSALLEQEVSKEVIANAISSTDISTAGMEFLDNLGITTNTFGSLLPHFSQFQYHFLRIALGGGICLVIILVIGVISFLQIRNNLYRQSGKIIDNYINNDYSCHLPQDSEGDLFHLFASVEQLATMLKAKSETEHKTKEFLKSTISDISHQIKTPVSAANTFAQLLDDKELSDEERSEYIATLQTSLEKLTFLTNSLIKMSRLESGIISLKPEKNSLNDIVLQAVKTVYAKAKEKNITITFDCEQNFEAMLDFNWTAEAITNILDNAVKYTPSGGIVGLEITEYPSYLRLDISDNGIGIPEEEQAKIFGRFYRGKQSAGIDGVGIGLYLTRDIINKQKGYIKVASDENGSVFSLFLKKD